MIVNRSVPAASVIAELAYSDVPEAAEWLSRAFGLQVRLRIGAHRIQMVFGNGALVVTELGDATVDRAHAMLVRVEDVDAHHEQAVRSGAKVLRRPADYPYGERQYTVEDLGGHVWTFTQSIADADPASWGGELVLADH